MLSKNLVLSATALLAASALAENYKFTTLKPTAPDYTLSWPTAINNEGHVLLNGTNNATGVSDGIFILKKKGVTRVQFPGAQPATAFGTALASDDRVGGIITTLDQSGNSFFELSDEGLLTIMPPAPAGADSGFYAMNNRGDFTTNGFNDSFCYYPYFFANGAYSPIQYPGNATYTAGGISNDDTVVGTLLTLQAGFTLRKGVFSLFYVPGAEYTHADCVSGSGHFIGGVYWISLFDEHAYVREGKDKFTTVDYPAKKTINGTYGVETLAHFSTNITGVNDKGEICGLCIARYAGQTGTEILQFSFTAEPTHGP